MSQPRLFSFINFLGSNGTGDFFILPGLAGRVSWEVGLSGGLSVF
jgi:hypothetical protein